jgi:hypothetical protein
MGIFGKKKEDSSSSSGWPAPDNKNAIKLKKMELEQLEAALVRIRKPGATNATESELASLITCLAEVKQELRDLRT